jgi:hypothetical protein
VNMHKLYIIRSRFQPFTRYHYDAISHLILQSRPDFEQGAIVLLAVIRDYETLMRLNAPEAKFEIADDDFRHLPLFNPLNLTDIILDIKGGLREYLTLKKENSDFLMKVMSEQLVIAPLYAKFSDLPDVLLHRHAFAPGVKAAFPRAENMKKDTQRQFLLMTNHTVYDILGSPLPGEDSNRVWFLPLLDIEDCGDARNISKLTRDKVLLGVYDEAPSFKISSLTMSSPLGVYGVFACYALAQLHQAVEQTVKETGQSIIEDLPKEDLPKIESVLKEWVIDSTLERYKTRLAERIRSIDQDFANKRRYYEKKLYLNAREIVKNCGLMATASESHCNDVVNGLNRNGVGHIQIGEDANPKETARQLTELAKKKPMYEAWTRLSDREHSEMHSLIQDIIGFISLFEKNGSSIIRMDTAASYIILQLARMGSVGQLKNSGINGDQISRIRTALLQNKGS